MILYSNLATTALHCGLHYSALLIGTDIMSSLTDGCQTTKLPTHARRAFVSDRHVNKSCFHMYVIQS